MYNTYHQLTKIVLYSTWPLFEPITLKFSAVLMCVRFDKKYIQNAFKI